MSPICTGPRTFLLKTLFWSRPSRILHLTCIASPLVPVLSTISSTFAGVAYEKSTVPFFSSCLGILSCCAGFSPAPLVSFPTEWVPDSVRASLALSFSILSCFAYYLLNQAFCFPFFHYRNASCTYLYSSSCSKLFLAWHCE